MTAELQKATDRLLARLVGALLRNSKYRARKLSSLACVLTPERKSILQRAALASEFFADGLKEAAHECLARKIAPGEILVYWMIDDEQIGAEARFAVVKLR